ncbi:protein arginine N-methyltransferase 9 [Xiphias gladius]|uniref:protein arginine N-methyltransferase 9 n=1 Tax=Xiphias gladius TaxID=8245 RepID=UPI001A97DFC5|nr:protein arginine N-methyltransferase 9 [Xiphias gladius]XP_040001780.1 protein arginine N-methyltransferase 9 [Xiphias gladius]XP_040001781.1 protein arginine N-methyltransferase 9 [Xiphias gladius]
MPNASARPKHSRRTRRRRREDPARNELVSSSLESAQQCLFNQDYGTAFVHYLLVLNLAPVFKDFAKESFRFTLFKWAEELDSVGRIQDLFDCYEQALELFPADEVILNSMGEHLFRMGFRDEAAGHFHKALKLRPDYPEARENFYRVANWLVERWHFLMLNDHGRNRKYQQAIQKAVQSGCNTVLDIGTGTGILGMCAKKAGAAEVYACELSKTMYELACEVVTANGMDGSIRILHMKSLEMEVPKDIPHRVSLVVTETVDAGLFGEGIIESLIHAWHHLLLPRQRGENEFREQSATGRVIPAGATVFGMAVECVEIRRHHRLCASEVGGLSMAAAGELRSPVSCSSEPDDSMEPYTTERLSRLPGGYKPLTEPFTALNIDFNNVQELEGLSSREVRQLCLPVLQEGELDALAVWFQLHLDEESSLSTGPQEDTCWEQAIYPVHSAKGFVLKPRDELIVEISCRDAYLRLCSVAVLRDGHEIRLDMRLDSRYPGNPIANPNPEAELCSALACLQTGQNPAKDFCMLECSEMALLNNRDYHQSFCSALGKLISQLKVKCRNQEQGPGVESDLADPANSTDCSDMLYVLDVSEGFSLLSLIAASQGHVKAYSSVEKNKQQEVLKRLARSNNIPEQHLEFWLNHIEDEQGMLQRPSREKLWSAIILDCVETCGLIRQKLMEKASLARCLLEEGGHIFPERIVVYGMLVESDTLLLESAVQGQGPTLGFNIAPFINQFTVPVHVFLDFSTLECRHLSESVELFVLDLMDANANYTNREVKVQATSAGRITAIPFWYQIYLNQEISVSTLDQNSHWKQAAAVLQQPLEVRAGNWVHLAVKLHKSTISISAHVDNAPGPME